MFVWPIPAIFIWLENKKWSLGFAIFWRQCFLRIIIPLKHKVRSGWSFPHFELRFNALLLVEDFPIMFLIYNRDLANIICFNQPLDLISTTLLWAWFKWYAAYVEPYRSLLQGRSWGSYLMWSWNMVYWSMKSSQVTKSELHCWDKFEMHHIWLIMGSFSCIFFFSGLVLDLSYLNKRIFICSHRMDF